MKYLKVVPDSAWQSGPPPAQGWYQASTLHNHRTLRWWNGRVWSVLVWPETDAATAARLSAREALWQGDICWLPQKYIKLCFPHAREQV